MIALLLAIVAAQAPVPMPTNLKAKTQVNGRAYTVEVKGREVKVKTGGAWNRIRMGQSVEHRDEARQAVLQVTSCRLIDDYWTEIVLRGVLECSAISR